VVESLVSQAKLIPIFDQAQYLPFRPEFPDYLSQFKQYEQDYLGAHAFLYAYKDNAATFRAYRREVERLLHWSWQIHQDSIYALKRADIEAYVKFCQSPPLSWIGLYKPSRFTNSQGIRLAHPDWRPFVSAVSKVESRKGLMPTRQGYTFSDKAIKDLFAILSSFFNFLIQDGYTALNPVALVRQKSKFIRRQQGQRQVRRLSDLQWSFVIETAELMANHNPQHERTLFILSALYLMYLRISELVVSDRWSPAMNDFKRDHNGLWWFSTVGKGNKQRDIAVSQTMLLALKRWRTHLGLSPLPTSDDQSPLVPMYKGKGGISSTNQIRNVVQACFDQAIARMIEHGLQEEVGDLQAATVHWLRHTGISDDVKRRPREHVRDDAGHSSSQTTDRYIDVDLRERNQSAQNKQLTQDS
jgi:site-specific recombinase XerD